jgi:hypothetical protein
MTLTEYIESREEQLDEQMNNLMTHEKVSPVGIAVISSAGTELERIKGLIEDGKIEGI